MPAHDATRAASPDRNAAPSGTCRPDRTPTAPAAPDAPAVPDAPLTPDAPAQLTYADKLAICDAEARATLVGVACLVVLWAVLGFGVHAAGVAFAGVPAWIFTGPVGLWVAALALSWWFARRRFVPFSFGDDDEPPHPAATPPPADLPRGADFPHPAAAPHPAEREGGVR